MPLRLISIMETMDTVQARAATAGAPRSSL